MTGMTRTAVFSGLFAVCCFASAQQSLRQPQTIAVDRSDAEVQPAVAEIAKHAKRAPARRKPHGVWVCAPEKKKLTVEKTCWKVACKPACIPAWRWPWERCRSPKCGWVRQINTLEKETYECQECETHWKVKCICR